MTLTELEQGIIAALQSGPKTSVQIGEALGTTTRNQQARICLKLNTLEKFGFIHCAGVMPTHPPIKLWEAVE